MEPEDLRKALNAVLPEDLVIHEVALAPVGFHARYSARARSYQYTIWNAPIRPVFGRQYVYHWRAFLDAPAMDRVGEHLVGKRDFAAFCGSTRGRERPVDTVRTLYRLHCWRDGERILIDATADAFLPHMVRNLVGTLLPVGLGQMDAAEVQAILGSRDRRRAGRTAPAQGLCLTGIWYD